MGGTKVLALVVAARNGHADVVQWMLEIGVVAEDGSTTLLQLRKSGKTDMEMIRRAVEFGVDVNARDDTGATALMYYCRAEKPNPEVVRRLATEYGADANARNDNGGTLLMFYCCNRRCDVEGSW